MFENFKIISKLSTKNIETLSQKQKMGETFSQSQDIAGDMGSCFNGEKLLEGQDSLVETCIVY